MKKYKFKLIGLDCANCANELEGALQKIDIIENVSISFMMQKLTFECAEENKEQALVQIRKVIKKEEPDVTIEEI
ncbi:MAG: heavy-metal-associated domain-containing protein [Bacilli bacterium]|nr:heavy-metal-associated domain-containing protein [Bacilli bacterium]